VGALAHGTGAGLMAACAAKFGGSHQGVAGLARCDGELNLHEGLRCLKKKLKGGTVKLNEKKPKAVIEPAWASSTCANDKQMIILRKRF
jgi:hypothetical protein